MALPASCFGPTSHMACLWFWCAVGYMEAMGRCPQWPAADPGFDRLKTQLPIRKLLSSHSVMLLLHVKVGARALPSSAQCSPLPEKEHHDCYYQQQNQGPGHSHLRSHWETAGRCGHRSLSGPPRAWVCPWALLLPTWAGSLRLCPQAPLTPIYDA